MHEPDEIENRINAFLDRELKDAPHRICLQTGIVEQLRQKLLRIVDAFYQFIATLRVTIIAASKAVQIRCELANHLRDSVDAELADGHSLEAALERSVQRFGDFDRHVAELEKLHRIPVMRWLTRFGALLIAWAVCARIHFHVSILLDPTFILGIILFPLAASLVRPSVVIFSWGYIAPRLLVMAGVGLTIQLWGGAAIAICCAALATIPFLWINQNLSSVRFAQRMRANILISAFLLMLSGFVHVVLNLEDPSRLGSGVATALLAPAYGILFGRPSWRWSCLFAVGIVAAIVPTLNAVDMPIEIGYPTNIFGSLLGIALGWAFLGRMHFRHWLPAAGILSTIILSINCLANLNDFHAAGIHFSNAVFVFSLFCLLAVVLDLAKLISRAKLRFGAE